MKITKFTDYFKKKVDYEEMLSDAFLIFLNDSFKTTSLKISKIENSIIIAHKGLKGKIIFIESAILKSRKVQFEFYITSVNSDIVELDKFLKEVYKKYCYMVSEQRAFYEIPNEDVSDAIKKLNVDDFEFYITANKYNL